MTLWDGGPFLKLCIDIDTPECSKIVTSLLGSTAYRGRPLLYGPFIADSNCYAASLDTKTHSCILYARVYDTNGAKIAVAPSTFVDTNDERWLSHPTRNVPPAVLCVHVFLLACVRCLIAECAGVGASITLETWDNAEAVPSRGCSIHPFVWRALFAGEHASGVNIDIVSPEMCDYIIASQQLVVSDPSKSFFENK